VTDPNPNPVATVVVVTAGVEEGVDWAPVKLKPPAADGAAVLVVTLPKLNPDPAPVLAKLDAAVVVVAPNTTPIPVCCGT
jgi:hypothetical protein